MKKTEKIMGEEDSNINKTEPESLDSVPEENFTIQENESEKPNTLNTINHESNELVASSLDPSSYLTLLTKFYISNT